MERFPSRLALSPYTLVDCLEFDHSITPHKRKRVVRLRGIDKNGNAWAQRVPSGAKVVLAAGAINTPSLLMKSGIGSEVRLAEADLGKPLVDLPLVGHHLQDHPAIGIIFKVTPELTADMSAVYQEFRNWTETGKIQRYPHSFGYPGFSTGGFFSSKLSDARPGKEGGNVTDHVPDLQFTMFPIIIEPHVMKQRMTMCGAP